MSRNISIPTHELTLEDRRIIGIWAGTRVPKSGPIVLLLDQRQYEGLESLLDMIVPSRYSRKP